MPDMREGDLGTAACYLTVERLALQAGVESPFWDEASLLMGGETGGATLGGYDDMTKEEIQAELDRQARESMMTISLDMTPTLSADGSKLAVRVANVEENRFDQLIEVEQDGEVIGSYKGLKPGEKLDEIDVTGAKPGAATVTVQAMEDGEPSGNPSGFEVTIAASE